MAGELMHGRLHWLSRLPLVALRHATVSTPSPGSKGRTDRPASQSQEDSSALTCPSYAAPGVS